jgi:hypothetical protein
MSRSLVELSLRAGSSFTLLFRHFFVSRHALFLSDITALNTSAWWEVCCNSFINTRYVVTHYMTHSFIPEPDIVIHMSFSGRLRSDEAVLCSELCCLRFCHRSDRFQICSWLLLTCTCKYWSVHLLWAGWKSSVIFQTDVYLISQPKPQEVGSCRWYLIICIGCMWLSTYYSIRTAVK